jgi:molybdopterin-guanine dinucleotide biosynthesis protein A
MTVKASGIILAGGWSSRLGRDKAEADVGLRMLDRVAQRLAATVSEILIAGGPVRRAPECGVPVSFVSDLEDSSGPLVGIYSAMLEAKCDASVVVGCDMPFVDPLLVWLMLESSAGADATVAEVGGVLQPLHAVYRKSALDAMQGLWGKGSRHPNGCWRWCGRTSSRKRQSVRTT